MHWPYQEEGGRGTQRRWPCDDRQALGDRPRDTWTPGIPRSWHRQEGPSPGASRGLTVRRHLALGPVTLVSGFRPPEPQRINFCCFKSPNQRHVSAAPGRRQTDCTQVSEPRAPRVQGLPRAPEPRDPGTALGRPCRVPDHCGWGRARRAWERPSHPRQSPRTFGFSQKKRPAARPCSSPVCEMNQGDTDCDIPPLREAKKKIKKVICAQ